MLLGALEAGGTKMVCAVGDETGTVLHRASFPTETPELTVPGMLDFFRNYPIEALGVGSFGPVDLNRGSSTYGFITTTPKLAWRNYDFAGTLQNALHLPLAIDTDVNAAALGEATFGCMKGLKNGIYITIGTGIGVGILTNGGLLHGMLHPEAGHLLLKRHPSDTYEGNCPYHKDCFEGLAAGPAIEARYGKKAAELAGCGEVWELEAFYIAQALVNYILTLSPERIVLGGGVMHQAQLFPLIHAQVKELLAGYIDTKELRDIEHYIVPASLNDNQAVMGCFALAMQARAGE